jgi:hypothetical protein
MSNPINTTTCTVATAILIMAVSYLFPESLIDNTCTVSGITQTSQKTYVDSCYSVDCPSSIYYTLDVWYDLVLVDKYVGHFSTETTDIGQLYNWNQYIINAEVPCYYYLSNITDTLRL